MAWLAGRRFLVLALEEVLATSEWPRFSSHTLSETGEMRSAISSSFSSIDELLVDVRLCAMMKMSEQQQERDNDNKKHENERKALREEQKGANERRKARENAIMSLLCACHCFTSCSVPFLRSLLRCCLVVLLLAAALFSLRHGFANTTYISLKGSCMMRQVEESLSIKARESVGATQAKAWQSPRW